MPTKKFQIFISSTFVDLKDEREAIAKHIIDMGNIPSGMEMFPATSMDQLSYIKKIIDDCDYYVLVLGGRYGSLTTTGTSFTEAEFDYAVQRGKVVLSFVHGSPNEFPHSVVDPEEESRTKFLLFRQKVSTGRIVKFWETPEQLSGQVSSSLHHAIRDFPATGWVRGDIVAKQKQEEEGRDFHENFQQQQMMKDLNETAHAVTRMFADKMKPATPAEVQQWVDGAKQNYPNPDELFSRHQVCIASGDFVLPQLTGSNALTIIIPKGVRVYKAGSWGHSRLLYMDEFRIDGL
jgi:hypothetical protein